MTAILTTSTIYFVACNAGPAAHFIDFANVLSDDRTVHFFAAGQALVKCREESALTSKFTVVPFEIENEKELMQEIARKVGPSHIIITECGHQLMASIHHQLSELKLLTHLAYYDNPEKFVPGGYSTTTRKVVEAAQGIIYGNFTLLSDGIEEFEGAKIDLQDKEIYGIGYYPIHKSTEMRDCRLENQTNVRQKFLSQNHLEEAGQSILVYMGGNNEVYFKQAFPAFLDILEQASEQQDLSNTIILIQQHGGAKKENQDKNLYEQRRSSMNDRYPQIIWSNMDIKNVQILADAVLYYQTSMGPHFVLTENLPVIQIGHQPYIDSLVKNQLCPVATTGEMFLKATHTLKTPVEINENAIDIIKKEVGYKETWKEALKRIITLTESHL